MSQVISPEVPSGSGLSVRQMINAVLAALMSNNSGPTEPTNPVPFQTWGDTTANDLKIRNAANTAWLLLSDMIGALEYDRAQSLNAAQMLQARANIGVDAALAGLLNAAIPYGAIGSYVMARCILGSVPEGNSVAGSTLHPAGGFSSLWINSVPQTYAGIQGPALSGVWQCHGRLWSYNDSGTSIGTATLFKRTS